MKLENIFINITMSLFIVLAFIATLVALKAGITLIFN